MRTKVLNASVAVLMTAGVVTAAPSAAADDWKVEGDGDSAGISHRQEILIQSDPVPEAGGGSYEGGSGGGEGVVEQEREDPCAGVPEAKRGSCAVAWRGLARPGGSAGPRGRAGAPVVVTSADVSRVMASGSGVVRQPPGARALVSRIVIVYTSSASQELVTRVGDQEVSVVATPVSYTWQWGDGTTTTTTDPGAAYPDHTVYHKYSRTARGVTITLTTTWTATYSVAGGPPQPVSGTLTTTDTADPFDLVRSISYLTDDAEEAQDH